MLEELISLLDGVWHMSICP